MEDCSSDGSTSFSTPKMPYELQSGVDTGSWSRNEIDGNVPRLANETDEISSSAIKGEPLESLNDVPIRGADSNTKTGGIKSEPTPAERERKTKHYKRSKRYSGKFSSMELATAHSISNGDACSADILVKLEVDDESRVKLSDFVDLSGDRIPVGKYGFPSSLHQIVKNITEVHGDVSATSKMNLSIAEGIYVMFCTSIKEMSGLRLEQVTEDLILKWRDAIRDALRIDFKVDFAMEHLKIVARAYIGLMERRKLDSTTSKISSLEAQLSAVKAEHSKISETFKEYMDAAEEFVGKTVSSGMF